MNSFFKYVLPSRFCFWRLHIVNMRHLFASFLLTIFTICAAFAQQKTGQIKRTDESIKVDGELSEISWLTAPELDNFITIEPKPGISASQKSAIKLLYNDEGIYVGAQLWDNSPDSILKQLSNRDEFANSDWFGIIFDPYQSGINGFGFYVTASGVQGDAKYSTFGEDFSWNAVWRSKITQTNEGWFVEMFIPFSALRFPDKEVQNWNVNTIRLLRRTREKSSWNSVNPAQNGFLNQFGELKGLENIQAPFRLQLFPYLSGYYQTNQGESSSVVNGGMDIKYGINDAYTLDMTLIPDFGQVQSDNQVLNLSPFEVRFNENRQFFTEGTELFNKGGLFYSRRIGGTPSKFSGVYDDLKEGETVEENPSSSKLINASKVSGRGSNGLGIGVFNAVSSASEAIIVDSLGNKRKYQTDPLTNYNVLVFDQNLKNNSYFTLINTNVMRSGGTYDANVLGFQTEIRDKKNSYSVRAGGAFNKKWGDISNTDTYLSKGKNSGFAHNLSVNKISGKFNFNVWYNVESETYDPNDLGFLLNNNEFSKGFGASYNIYEPKGYFNRKWVGINGNLIHLYENGRFQALGIGGYTGGITKNFHAIGFDTWINPVENYDFFDPRKAGYFYKNPTSWYNNIWISSDYRKRFAIDGNIGYEKYSEQGRYDIDYRIAPRFRISDKMMLIYSFTRSINNNNVGYAIPNGKWSDGIEGMTAYNDTAVYYGSRNRNTYVSLLNLTYNFNPVMGLSYRMRHYWSTVNYNKLHELGTDGRVHETNYTGINENGESMHNNSFNAFNIDLVYTWVFSPGSELSIVWKNAILLSDDIPVESYNQNFKTVLDNPGTNSFSIKLLYFLDYQTLKSRLLKKN